MKISTDFWKQEPETKNHKIHKMILVTATITLFNIVLLYFYNTIALIINLVFLTILIIAEISYTRYLNEHYKKRENKKAMDNA